MQAAVKTEEFNGTNGYYGASFMSYGGNSFIGNFLGTFEALWVIAYMVQLSEIALAPFVLSYLINKTWVDAPTDLAKSFDLIYLYWGFIIAFGSFVSAWALGESADRLIGFFDIQNTAAVEFYKEKFGKEPTWDEGTAFTFDVFHHSMTILGYFLVGAAVADTGFAYVYAAVTGTEVDFSLFDI